MNVQRSIGRYGDRLFAAAVAVLFTVELLRWDATDRPIAIPLGLAASALLLRRRRLPLLAFVLILCADFGVANYAPDFDANSISYVLVFIVGLYSLGRHARGLEAWLGVGGVLP